MSKLSYEDKIEIYNEIKNGKTFSYLSTKYNIRIDNIKYLVRLIDKHGYDILRTIKKRTFSTIEKERIINRVIFINNKERYGYRRITLELRNQGYNVNHKKVYRIMVKLGLKALKRNKRKYSSYKGTVGKIADNLIERDFNADKPNQKWYTDVTEFNLRGEKCYLSPILDGYKGEVISYNTSKSPSLEQINDLLNKAFDKNNNLDDLIKAIDDYIYYYNYDRIKVKLKGLSPVNYRLQSSN